ncbi:sphingomyelin phosphodiesterase 5-like [Babylonia areolata]|uniref:sphingomyelin phosphodiesterase 5-like n=1 Tax=Babylonia areolata TaxID=304850 RepID=UPI003FD04596
MVKSVSPGLQPSVSLPRGLDELLSFLVMLIWPSYSALSGFLCLWMPITVEKEDPSTLLFKRIVLAPVYAVLFLLSLPLALCAIPVRCLLSFMKKPYRYSVQKMDHTQFEEDILMKHLSSPTGLASYEFGIATGNVCLLGEFVARINNLKDSGHRATSIGERIVVDQLHYGRDAKSVCGLDGSATGKNHTHVKAAKQEVGFVGGLVTHFPRLDFVCLQEVADWSYNKLLRKELHKVFPYILHDVGVWSVKTNYFMYNSGLMLASRHPVLDVDFKCYPRSVSQCLLISKGLLMVKVLIGEETDSRRQVGYVYTSHLQAYQGQEPVLLSQLDNIVEWTAEFRKKTADSRDVVLFDVLCGDFNFDNMSPGDKVNRDHRLFDVYLDPCRIQSGQDEPWSVGTEFKQIFMHESMAMTPESLKLSLADPVLRHRYIVDADIEEQSMDTLVNVKLRTDKHGNIVTFPEAGMRRIDYVMSRKDTPMDITKLQFVTRLASLSDHVPVAMTFKAKV